LTPACDSLHNLGMKLLDNVRVRAHAALGRVPGKVGDSLRRANEALGRPLADADELADRRAFETRAAAPDAAKPAPKTGQAAPVIVYHMDKQRRDVPKVLDILDANGVPYKVMNIQEDPAAQSAIRRDSNGQRLPVVFIAGECVGGREKLTNLASSGELKRKVFGG
jgi:glutaredoxin-related protein